MACHDIMILHFSFMKSAFECLFLQIRSGVNDKENLPC